MRFKKSLNSKKLKKCLAGVLAASILTGSGLAAPTCVSAKLTWSGPMEQDSMYPGAKYAYDENNFVYVFPKNATTAKGAVIIGYGGASKSIKLPAKADQYKLTNIGTAFMALNVESISIPSGYTTIESKAFMGNGKLYRVSIPASVKNIAADAFDSCDMDKLTIVAPYGSAAEMYAFEKGIHYSNTTSLQIQTNGTTMYVGEKKQLAVLNNNKTVSWKSSNKSVATVDSNGLVTGKKAGSTKISATISGKTYSYTFKVLSRTQSNVLKVVWSNYVTASMSDYEKAVAAQKWVESHISVSGSSSSVKTALENGKVNYTGRANTYKKILEHYGLKVSVVKGSKNVENSVVIAGKTYKVSALTKSSSVNKAYATTTLEGVAINRNTMNLSVGGTDTFKVLGTSKKVTYSSSNKKVATVTSGGKVTAKGAGTATIIMKMDAKTYKLRVRVNK